MINTLHIPLTRGQVSVVSMEDLNRVESEGPWQAIWSDKWYACNGQGIKMHRFIMNAPDGVEVDHVDGNGLNNERGNLRISTRLEGAKNRKVNRTSRSGYRGVHRRKDGRFRVHVASNGKRGWHGTFNTLKEAVDKQIEVSKYLHGSFFRISNLDIDPPVDTPLPNPKKNRTNFIGVRKNGPNFQAYVTCGGKTLILGQFETSKKAAIARDEKAKTLKSPKIKLNFPLVAISILLLFTNTGYSVLPVVDYAGNIQNEINAIKGYILQGYQYIKEGEIDINTNLTALRELQQVENEILQLARMGDPTMLITLPGISNIVTLEQIYQQFQKDVADLTALANPANVTVDYQQILQQYGLTGFNGFTSGWGIKTSVPNFMIQFDQSSYDVSYAASQKIQTLVTQKQALSTQRDQAMALESAATDTETRTRYHNQVMSLSAAIADINASIDQAIHLQNLQQQQIQAARGLNQTSNTLQAASIFQQDAENGVASMTGAPGIQGNGTVVGNSSEFGYVDNPAIGGTGDPGTSGSWNVGAGGANIGDKTSTGISLPLATEVAMFGSEQAALGQAVMVTNNNNGQSVATTIVDVGPGSQAVAAGNIVDLTYGTASALGTEGRSTNVTVSKVQ